MAFESPDHIVPWGTARDSSKNYRFNQKLNKLFENFNKPLKILDLGCSGGGFVADCINDGCIAVGLEGSDYSYKIGRAEWSRIPNNLFTCDVTKPFKIFSSYNDINEKIHFDIITSFEIMEHIKSDDIKHLASNVKEHMKESSLWIMSVSSMDDIIDGVNLHQTVQPYEWWVDMFKSLGLFHQPQFLGYFNQQYVRSTKYGAPGSFILILSLKKQSEISVPKLPISQRLLDLWIGSRLQKQIKKIVNGPQSYA